MPTLRKFFESLVYPHLYTLSPTITPAQHGFVSKRSCVTNLTQFVNSTMKEIASKGQMDVFITDFHKAFDRVDQIILIDKIVNLGVCRRMAEWLWSYLHDRQLYVKIGSRRSSTFVTDSGVPQGSHLGPLLFLIFINDLTAVIRLAFILMYADDVKLFLPIRQLSSSIEFQRDISALANWCQTNRLPLNIRKCKVMSFTRRTHPITAYYHIEGEEVERVTEFKDLGLYLDTTLSFKKHFAITYSNAYAMLGFMKRICSKMTNPYAFKSVYCAFIRSKLEYACIVWSPFYNVDSNKIESIQKQFLLYALRRLGWNICFAIVRFEMSAHKFRNTRTKTHKPRHFFHL